MSGPFDDFLRSCAEDCVNGGSGRVYAAGIQADAQAVAEGRADVGRRCPDCGGPVRRRGEDGRCRCCTDEAVQAARRRVIEARDEAEERRALRLYAETLRGEDLPAVMRRGQRRRY